MTMSINRKSKGSKAVASQKKAKSLTLSDLSGIAPKTVAGKQAAAVRDEWKRIARAELRKDPKNGLKKASKIYAIIRKEKGIKLKKRTC